MPLLLDRSLDQVADAVIEATSGLDHRAGHVASMAVPENKCLVTVQGCNA